MAYPKIEPILNRLQEHLLAANYRELQEELGVSRGTMDVWKQKDNIPKSRLIVIAREKGVNLDWLYTGEDHTKSTGEAL